MATAVRSDAMRIWLMAARVRTLPAAVAPVLVGTSLAITEGVFRAGAFVAALLGALLIQIGTNLANDYSDARRGADAEDRVGPVRVTAGGLVPPRQVLVATYVTFGLAVVCGLYLVAVAGIELLFVGIASIAAGVLYTGGPKPYGYEGLGELFVFAFFGVVAVTGSAFAQLEAWPWEAFVLAVRLGREPTRRLYALAVLGAYVVAPLPWLLGALSPWLLAPWLTLPLALALVRRVREHADGPTLNEALAQTGMLQLAFSLLLSAGVLAS
jgi:1,4-dihydroxy-2-naphthoate polyprenyltransferase